MIHCSDKLLISSTRQIYSAPSALVLFSCYGVSSSLDPPGLQPTCLFCPWYFPGKNAGVGCHFLLWGIFPIQGSNPPLLHWQAGSLPLSHLGIYMFIYKATWPQVVSVQFHSVAQSCPTLCDPMNRSMPGLPVHHQLLELTQTHVHRVSDAIQPSHPLSSPSPPAPNPSQHQSLFQ